MTTAEEVLFQGIKIFDQLGARYAIHGGMALNYWGRPRATGDIDFFAIIDETLSKRLMDYAKERGWKAAQELENRLNIYLPGTQLYLEIWFARSDFEKNVVERGAKKRMDGIELVLARAEDVIILKLLRFTALDMEDIISIMDKQGEDLDCRYVLKWASRLRKTHTRLVKCSKNTVYSDFWESCLKG